MDSPPQEAQAPEPIAGSPSDFLKNIVGKKVKVRIGSGVDYHGMSMSSLPSYIPAGTPLQLLAVASLGRSANIQAF
jgi:U6 snRNA-associated Sm-like protein LSm6